MAESDLAVLKMQAAEAAIAFVKAGMILGLGTGSTAACFIKLLGEKSKKEGINWECYATSSQSEQLALKAGLHLKAASEENIPVIDLAVDGTDECDSQLRLIKGGGGALLREKIIANHAKKFIVIADDSKSVQLLGRFPLPIEITPFSPSIIEQMIINSIVDANLPRPKKLCLRQDKSGSIFRSDEGNLIFDLAFEQIPDPQGLVDCLNAVPGVVEHGLFLKEADLLLIASESGTLQLDRY